MSLLNRIRPAGTKKIRVKAMLTGGEETGKSTSVLYGAERPLLVIDLEDGTEIFKHAVESFDIYPSNDPDEIYAFVQELLAFARAGGKIPYNSIFIDSGTDLYKKIIQNEIRRLQIDQGKPSKRTLEPKEYGYPNGNFYDIIKGLKSLDVDFYVACHASDNYLKGDFMKIDPNNPVKADVHKDLAHEMDVHIIFKKLGGKNRKIKAEVKKSRLDDKDGNPLLPAAIDDVDNKTFIKMIREFATRDKGFEQEKPKERNVIRTDGELSTMVDEIIEIVSHLRLTPQDAMAVIKQTTEGRVESPHQLSKDEAIVVLNAFKTMRDSQNPTGE
jgi:hypothetical protein